MNRLPPAKPVLKWAGGKRQLLDQLQSYLPQSYDRYIEPMIGGGALFFELQPEQAIIADSNPELINFYRTLVSDLQSLVDVARLWPVNEETFYRVRAMRFGELDEVTAAARLLYLNRTCFNGLYRVNRKGEFNVPWGRYISPTIINFPLLEAARERLRNAEILLGDYVEILRQKTKAGDLVFLDPPYLPISLSADFKRYTKEQFSEADHREMRNVVGELHDKGCTTIITNSNHPLMYELYRDFSIDVIETRRNINAKAAGRKGQDIIVFVPPRSPAAL